MTKGAFLLGCLLAFSDLVFASCDKPTANEKPIMQNDFYWGFSLVDMAAKFSEMYSKPQRLQGRAYYDKMKDHYVMPFTAAQGGNFVITKGAIAAIKYHIEEALKHTYANFVFFPDMGHAHFMIPQRSYDKFYASLPVSQLSRLYAMAFADEDVKFLYHTAEQLQTLEEDNKTLKVDRAIQWRYYTRNLVGQNKSGGTIEIAHDLESKANTVGELEDYRNFGGFNISAQKDSCFSYTYKGQEYFFDISMEDLPTARDAVNGDLR